MGTQLRIDHWEEWTPGCDCCGLRGRDFKDNRVQVDSMDNRNNGAPLARRLAKQAGWVVKGGKTLCPKCATGKCSKCAGVAK